MITQNGTYTQKESEIIKESMENRKMGTRSITRIYRDKKLILAMYKQYDGYTDSWGKELKDFIKGGKWVNGFTIEDKQRQFNGIGCFALQLVAKFKDGVGDLYATESDCQDEEYNYKIVYKWDKERPHTITITCKEDRKFKQVWVLGVDSL